MTATARWESTDAPDTGWSARAVAGCFMRFAADRCAGGYAPLYQRLIGLASTDPFIIDLATRTRRGQSPPDLVLAAVHRLLLADPAQRLADFYPTLRTVPEPGDPYPHFRDLCENHAEEITVLLQTRLVQTNEVRRCTYLWPALALIAGATGRALGLCEVGASAGLNLQCDRYGYDYDGHRAGDPGSPLLLACELEGAYPLPTAPVAIGWRRGLDLNPLDVADPDDARWLRALVWADHPQRLSRLDLALDVARSHPVEVRAGDARTDVADVVSDAPADAVLAIWHTATAAHMPAADRAAFDRHIVDIATERPLLRLQAEPRAPGQPRLRVTVYAGDAEREVILGDYHPHGATLTWRPDPDAAGIIANVRA